MWIIAGGSKRSGSTLQYNIVSELIERTKTGQRVEFAKPENFNSIYEKYDGVEGYKIFKCNELTPKIRQLITEGKALGLFCYRDLRDVIVSFKNKDNLNIQNSNSVQNLVNQYLQNFHDWIVLNNTLVSKYENFVDDIESEISRISLFLGLEVDDKDVSEIAKKLHRSNLKKSQANPENEVFVKNSTKGFYFDNKTLLHKNHIHSGEPNQWKNELPHNVLNRIEKTSAEWLYNNGYVISNAKLIDGVSLYSYSQHGEDNVIWRYFNKKNNGLIIEIGAFDGKHLSNSIALNNVGWKSICVEPSPSSYRRLKLNRPHSININAAVVGSKDHKEIEFIDEELGLLSGIDVDLEDVKNRYEKRGLVLKTPKRELVSAKTLDSILIDCNIKPKEIDCISIDVEGFELEVLAGFDIKKFQPKLLIIEANNLEAEQQLNTYFERLDYQMRYRLGPNLFYVRDEIKDFNTVLTACKFINPLHPLGEEYSIKSRNPNVERKITNSRLSKYWSKIKHSVKNRLRF